jgi:hypothetical protein
MYWRAHHLSLSWARKIQPTHLIYSWTILIPSHLHVGLQVGSSFKVSPWSPVCTSHLPHTHHLILRSVTSWWESGSV